MFCSKCGYEIGEGAAFCSACGGALSDNKSQLTEGVGSVSAKPMMSAKHLKTAIVAGIALIAVIVIFIVINGNSPLVGRWINGHGTTIEFFPDGRVIYQSNTIGTWSSDGGRVVLDFPGNRNLSGIWQFTSRPGSGPSGHRWTGRQIMWRPEWGSLTNININRPDSVFIRQ